jgi:hypothetical protein
MLRRGVAVIYHGRLIGPNGQVYQCEHNHRTETAAVSCANSSATRRMAAIAWNGAAVQAAQAAALAKKREEERAAAQARKVAAQQAAAARRAVEQAAAEKAKAAKRAAKLAAMSPRRAWKHMTPEERLLRTAEAELEVYGQVISPEAKAVYDVRTPQGAPVNAPGLSESAPAGAAPPRDQPAAGVPAYLRALGPGLPPDERTVARGEAAGDPVQWQKNLAGLRAQHESQAGREIARLKAAMNGRGGRPGHGGAATRSAEAPSKLVLPEIATPAPNVAHDNPAVKSGGGFGGDGLFVVGLDTAPGVYRTAGSAGGRLGSFALLKSTSTRDVLEFNTVKGPATITVGPRVRAVHVNRCQPWCWLGYSLDAVIAAARNPDGP